MPDDVRMKITGGTHWTIFLPSLAREQALGFLTGFARSAADSGLDSTVAAIPPIEGPD